MTNLDRNEQMERAVNDMQLRFPSTIGEITSDFFTSRLDRPTEGRFNKYHVPLIADNLFSGGTYKRQAIAGTEVLEELLSPMWRDVPLTSGYGSRTFFELKSKNEQIFGRAKVTFYYFSGLQMIPLNKDPQNPIADPSEITNGDEFIREMDHLEFAHRDEAAVYQIDLSEVKKFDPEKETISELVDERNTAPLGSCQKYKELKERGVEVRHVNRLPGNEQVIDYFRKIWI